jgi:hypothetical protein
LQIPTHSGQVFRIVVCTAFWQPRPEKVYRAFLEADALAKWLPPNGFACTVHHLEPKVGGTFKAGGSKCPSGISRRAKAIR